MYQKEVVLFTVRPGRGVLVTSGMSEILGSSSEKFRKIHAPPPRFIADASAFANLLAVIGA